MAKKKIPMKRVKRSRNKQKIVKKVNLTPSQIDLITRISKEHSYNTFGYLDSEDLEGEIWRICLEVLPDFNKDEGHLEHFLRVSVKNRLVNKFKEITKSVRSPCTRCPYYDKESGESDCARYDNAGTQKEPTQERNQCDKWKNYQMSIVSRNSLLNPVEYKIEQEISDDAANKLIAKEFLDIIMSNVDEQDKKDIESLMSGSHVPKNKVQKLRQIVSQIVEEKGLQDYLE